MTEPTQIDRLKRMHKGAQDVLAMVDKQREWMLSEVRELKVLIELEESK